MVEKHASVEKTTLEFKGKLQSYGISRETLHLTAGPTQET